MTQYQNIYIATNSYLWENYFDWLEALELKLEIEEEFYEQEYYSKIPSHKKEDAGWWNDYRLSRMYTRRYESKPTIAKHRARRKARKETRSFDRHREIDEAVSNYLELIFWEDMFALEAWPNA